MPKPRWRRLAADDRLLAARVRPVACSPRRKIQDRLGRLKRRTRQITRMPFPVSNLPVAPDSRTIVFVTTEPAGARERAGDLFNSGRRPAVDARHPARPAATMAADEGRGGGGGFGGGISDLNISRDGRTLFFSERDGDLLSRAWAAQAPRPPLRRPDERAAESGRRRRINFNVRVKIDQSSRMGRDVRRRLADDEVSLLRSQDARHGLGRDARAKYQAAGRVRRRPAGAAQHHQRDDRRVERLAHRRAPPPRWPRRRRRRDRPSRHRARARRRRRPLQRRPTSTKMARPTRTGSRSRSRRLPDRDRRQAGQSRRRLLAAARTIVSTAKSKSPSTTSPSEEAPGRRASSRSRRRPTASSVTSAG